VTSSADVAVRPDALFLFMIQTSENEAASLEIASGLRARSTARISRAAVAVALREGGRVTLCNQSPSLTYTAL
jgi:hypothetical protein